MGFMLTSALQYSPKETRVPGLSVGRKNSDNKEDAVAEMNKVGVLLFPLSFSADIRLQLLTEWLDVIPSYCEFCS